MRKAIVGAALLTLAALASTGCGGGGRDANEPVSFAKVEQVFVRNGCLGCHPIVNPSLDLQPGKAYASLVGVAAVEDPRLVRVVAGDPEHSFLYRKINGDPALGDIPAIGSRMPPGRARIAQADIDIVRDWIAQGAKNADGVTAGPVAPSPGEVGPGFAGDPATTTRGTATLTGVVLDQRRRPIPGAIVTLLLKGPDQEGGEEHYRAALTDRDGRYLLPNAPAGRYLLKAYAPRTIYVSHVVAPAPGERAVVDFGLADRAVAGPVISRPGARITGSSTVFTLAVSGSNLDPNYTLAVNRRSGEVVELRGPQQGPAVFRRTLDRRIEGTWVFLAVDHSCNISDFLTVAA